VKAINTAKLIAAVLCAAALFGCQGGTPSTDSKPNAKKDGQVLVEVNGASITTQWQGSAALLLATHAMVEFPLAYLYYLVPFAMAIGIVEVDADMPRGVVLPRAAGPVAVLALCAAMVAAALDYVRLEAEWREMRFTVARIGRPMVDTPPLIDTMFTQLAAQHRAWLTTPKPGMSPEEVRDLVAASERYGYAPLLYRSALALALNGDVEGGKRMLRRLENVHLPVYHATALGEIRSLAETEYPVLRALLPAP